MSGGDGVEAEFFGFAGELLALAAGVEEVLLGLKGGKALVNEDYFYAGAGCEEAAELCDFFGGAALCAVHVQGQAEDDSLDGFGNDHFGDLIDGLWGGGDLQNFARGGELSAGVAHCQADAAFSEVYRQRSHWKLIESSEPKLLIAEIAEKKCIFATDIDQMHTDKSN
jgi:hypothetical protein